MIATVALLMSLTAHPPSAVPKPKPIELSGKVREASNLPGKSQAVLTLDSGEEWVLHATSDDLRQELVRLAGTKVALSGLHGDPRFPRGNHALVERYQIVDAGNGQVPRVGLLASIELDGKTRLLFVDDGGQAETLPEGWNDKMRRHVGAKLWIVGTKVGEKFTPTRYALLRTKAVAPAPEAPATP